MPTVRKVRITALAAGLLCALWAFIGWLAVIPNQDILADGIQAQSLLIDPRIVLAFPGQKHGLPLEYPFTIFFEWLFPGNYYANGVIRILLAFLTGYFTGRLALALVPGTRVWALLLAIGLGPTIIHGLQGPGVWWLQPNYDMAWLLITAGALTLASVPGETPGSRPLSKNVLKYLGAGLLFGLGISAHPVMILMAIPLGSLVLLIKRIRPTQVLLSLVGLAVGMVPAVINYFVNDEVNVWDPSHKPFIYPEWIWTMGRRVMGLDGIPDPGTAILPYSLDLSPTQTPFSGIVQSLIVFAILSACLALAITGTIRAARTRQWISPLISLALAWLVAAGTPIVFITVVNPVYFYGAGNAVLAWISIGALPSLISGPLIGRTITIAFFAMFGLSTLAQNAHYLSSLPERVVNKRETLEKWRSTATALSDAGVDIIYGSYLDAIPIGYVSNWKLRTVTYDYNRFPLQPSHMNEATVLVAARVNDDDENAQKALEIMRRECTPLTTLDAFGTWSYQMSDCPTLELR